MRGVFRNRFCFFTEKKKKFKYREQYCCHDDGDDDCQDDGDDDCQDNGDDDCQDGGDDDRRGTDCQNADRPNVWLSQGQVSVDLYGGWPSRHPTPFTFTFTFMFLAFSLRRLSLNFEIYAKYAQQT